MPLVTLSNLSYTLLQFIIFCTNITLPNSWHLHIILAVKYIKREVETIYKKSPINHDYLFARLAISYLTLSQYKLKTHILKACIHHATSLTFHPTLTSGHLVCCTIKSNELTTAIIFLSKKKGTQFIVQSLQAIRGSLLSSKQQWIDHYWGHNRLYIIYVCSASSRRPLTAP